MRQLLGAVEGGCGLTYTITASYDSALLDATSPVFYNSLYDDLRQTILQNMEQLEEYYSCIAASTINRHAILENGLRETIFDNGVRVYVNYSNEPLESPAGRVPAMSFQIQKGTA